MIEELEEYLIRHGVNSLWASEIHDAYCKDMKEACRVIRNKNDSEHDYLEELTKMILEWRLESGESLKHIKEFVVESAAVCACERGGWYVDANTYCGRTLRYTVLGRTPYAIKDQSEAEDFAADAVDDIIDEGSWA